MPKIFVSADNARNSPVVADIYDFAHIPRKGDEVVIDDGKKQYILEVQLVRHFPQSTGGLQSAGEVAHLECKLLQTINI